MSTLDIKWDDLITYDANKFLIENEDLDIPIGERFIEVPTNNNHHKLLVVDNGNRNYKFFVIKFIPLKTLDKNLSFSLLNKDDFTGFIDLIDDGNEITDLGYFIEGNLISIEGNSEDNKNKMAVDCYVVTTEHWTDWYVNGSYVDSTLDDITRETVCYGSGGGSGGGGTGGGSTGGYGTGGTSPSDQTVLDTKIMQKELSELESIYKHLMSDSELDIYENDLTFSEKFLYLKSAYDATQAMKIEFSNIGCRSGIPDAFRHTLWNALSTQRIGFSLTDRLTTAHEDITFEYDNHFKEKQMDLFNNEKGRNIGASSYSGYEATNSTRQAMNNGELVYLSNIDPVSCYATDQSSLVPTHN